MAIFDDDVIILTYREEEIRCAVGDRCLNSGSTHLKGLHKRCPHKSIKDEHQQYAHTAKDYHNLK